VPKIDIDKLKTSTSTFYPAPFDQRVRGRERKRLGEAAGLTQFGVNLTRLKPGLQSSLRHWHEHEDELVYVLEGELVLVEDGGETVMRAGDAAGFKAGVANGHHFVNRSDRDAVYLEIGTRSPRERAHYPDDDLAHELDERGFRFTHKSGEPYAKGQR
jgi:uncharacterized cupin superfamily protein